MYQPSEVINDERLAGILRCRVEDIPILIAKRVSFNESGSYISFVDQKKIPKRNKRLGYRIVYKLNFALIDSAIKAFKYYLNSLYTPVECVHGFVTERNIVTNSTPHLAKPHILNVDIENFFENISVSTVSQAFEKLGFIPTIARKLAEISTYDGKLVAGFPTSPTIANIVCIDMDNAIIEFCRERDLIYTRYADDISISGEKVDILKDIEGIINSFGFNLNSKKTKLFKKGQSQYVTGLTVCDSSYPRIPRRFKDKLRQKLYYMDKYGLFSHIERQCDYVDESELFEYCRIELNRVKGWIDFINSIEPIIARKYYSLFNKINKAYQTELEGHMKYIAEHGPIIQFKLPNNN